MPLTLFFLFGTTLFLGFKVFPVYSKKALWNLVLVFSLKLALAKLILLLTTFLFPLFISLAIISPNLQWITFFSFAPKNIFLRISDFIYLILFLLFWLKLLIILPLISSGLSKWEKWSSLNSFIKFVISKLLLIAEECNNNNFGAFDEKFLIIKSLSVKTYTSSWSTSIASLLSWIIFPIA